MGVHVCVFIYFFFFWDYEMKTFPVGRGVVMVSKCPRTTFCPDYFGQFSGDITDAWGGNFW